MENVIELSIPGTKKVLYGKRYGKKQRPIVVFVHGLTGHMDEHIFYNGARFFDAHGFSSFRFNLYDFEPDTRKLDECTLKTHARDLVLVLAYLWQEGFREIHVVGHSYGGPTIAMADLSVVSSAVLWDPTYNYRFKDEKTTPVLKGKGRLLHWSYRVMLGKKMFEENAQMDWFSLYAGLDVPTKVIFAGDGVLYNSQKSFEEALDVESSFKTIKRAGHCFDEDGKEGELFVETLEWIKAFSK